MMEDTPFNPDWVSPPGESIKDLADEKGVSTKVLATKLGLSDEQLAQLLTGNMALTPEIAVSLELSIGGSSAFWNSREKKYRDKLSSLALKMGSADAQETHNSPSCKVIDLDKARRSAITKRLLDAAKKLKF